MRVSHEDRDQVVERLQVAAVDGRLTAEELDERVESALTARTYGDLEVLLGDLPAAPGTALTPTSAHAPAPAPAAKESVEIKSSHSNIQRKGHWAVPRKMTVENKHGNLIFDFTEAVISQPALDLAVSLAHGNLVLRVPSGVTVDTDDVTLRHGNVSNRVRHHPGTPAKLLITVSGDMRHGNLVVRGPRPVRRGFWAWLFRRPLPPEGSSARNAINA